LPISQTELQEGMLKRKLVGLNNSWTRPFRLYLDLVRSLLMSICVRTELSLQIEQRTKHTVRQLRWHRTNMHLLSSEQRDVRVVSYRQHGFIIRPRLSQLGMNEACREQQS
jgi:hypothetical protein